jgi:hypothetical protein
MGGVYDLLLFMFAIFLHGSTRMSWQEGKLPSFLNRENFHAKEYD